MLVTTATNLPRLMACNGSRIMSPSFPNIDTDRTLRDEGDAADWVAEQVFNGVYQLEELAERKAENGVFITTDMIDHVGSYLSALDCGQMQVNTSFGTDEWRVNARTDHIIHTDNRLTVDDLKYGWKIVEPHMNWTLIAHAIGYCIINQVQPDFITFRIHQPRPHHPDGKLREWTIAYRELMDLYGQLVATLSAPSDTLNTGPQCTNCYALATCPAARKAGYNAVDAADIAFNDDISNEALAFELDTLTIAQATLERRVEALQELTKHRVGTGGVVGDYFLEPQYANRRFKPGLSGKLLSLAAGTDMEKSGTVTPAEAERRLIAAGRSKEQAKAIVTSLSERPATGIKLARRSMHDRAVKSFGKPKE